MGGYGPRMVEVRVPEMDMYMGRQQQLDGDGEGSSVGGDDKEKGRGSYKCGRVSEMFGRAWVYSNFFLFWQGNSH
jgi:hypothetical protein